jgi:hypothetical protein
MTVKSFEPIMRFERPPDPVCGFDQLLGIGKRALIGHSPSPGCRTAAFQKLFFCFSGLQRIQSFKACL